ncbi:MAG TPA: hypothetical protein PLY87_30980 [Planctomycetaceae bacterium]|nr:hypothetical protein [Planctomycetaceae bacterium]
MKYKKSRVESESPKSRPLIVARMSETDDGWNRNTHPVEEACGAMERLFPSRSAGYTPNCPSCAVSQSHRSQKLRMLLCHHVVFHINH